MEEYKYFKYYIRLFLCGQQRLYNTTNKSQSRVVRASQTRGSGGSLNRVSLSSHALKSGSLVVVTVVGVVVRVRVVVAAWSQFTKKIVCLRHQIVFFASPLATAFFSFGEY